MSDVQVLAPEKEDKKEVAIRSDINEVVVTSWEDMQRMANAFSKSTLIPQHLRGKFEDVLVILQTAKEIGVPPLQAMGGVNVIQGKPSISPELQLALIKAKCPEAFIKIEIDEEKQTAKCTMAPSRERLDESFTSTWDMKKAKAMGLDTKDNYKKQPLTMLRWRAVGEAARTVFPHLTRGLYNSEEARDLMPGPSENKPSIKELFGKTQTVMLEDDGPSGVEVETK